MKPRSNTATEQAWIDAWNDLYALSQGFGPCAIVLHDGDEYAREGDLDACRSWLQSSVYAGFCVGLRRYRRRDGRVVIHAKRWAWGGHPAAWEKRTADGFVLDE